MFPSSLPPWAQGALLSGADERQKASPVAAPCPLHKLLTPSMGWELGGVGGSFRKGPRKLNRELLERDVLRAEGASSATQRRARIRRHSPEGRLRIAPPPLAHLISGPGRRPLSPGSQTRACAFARVFLLILRLGGH